MAAPLTFFFSSDALLVLLVLAAPLLLLLLLLRRRPRTSPLLPPSPPSLPIFGHLHLLPITSRLSFVPSYSRLLGPIFSVRLARIPVIFVASSSLAHEALVQKGSFFAFRPHPPSRRIFTSDFHNISSSDGPFWRTMRRNIVHEMLSPAKTLTFMPFRERAVDLMIQRLRESALLNQGVVCVYPIFRMAVFNLLTLMCFGFFLEEETLLQISSLMAELLTFQRGFVSDFAPYLAFLDRNRRKKALALRERQLLLYAPIVERHRKLEKRGELTTPECYLATLLNGPQDSAVQLSMSDIVSLCSEFLVGGIDTTVTALEWTMAHLVKDPLIQAKLYQHIYDVVGDRPVQENDLPKLPYLQAVITESLRLHPPGHFLLPHAVSQPCKLGGYDITPDAIVNFNVLSINRDPEIWEEPLEYKPERMLDANVDMTGTTKITMMTFGAGRRICPGLGLAATHLQLFLSRLVQVFEWHTTEPGETVDLSEKFVFTVVMKNSLKARITERNPVET